MKLRLGLKLTGLAVLLCLVSFVFCRQVMAAGQTGKKCCDASQCPQISCSVGIARRWCADANCPYEEGDCWGSCESGDSSCGNAKAPGCEGSCDGGVCRRKVSEPWKCVCGQKAEGESCPEGTCRKCGWECKKNCTNKGDGSCTKANGTKGIRCHVCECVGLGCFAAAPTNLAAVSVSESQAQITWTPDLKATSQTFLLDLNAAAVESQCVEGCLIIAENIDPTANGYATDEVLEPGTTYYYKVITIEDKSSDPDCPQECSPKAATGSFVHWPVAGEAWWQAQGGGVHAEGSVINSVPAGEALIRLDNWGAGALVSYGGGLDYGPGELVEGGLNWRANTWYRGLRTGYAYFYRILQDDPEGIAVWTGIEPEESGIYRGENLGQTGGEECPQSMFYAAGWPCINSSFFLRERALMTLSRFMAVTRSAWGSR